MSGKKQSLFKQKLKQAKMMQEENQSKRQQGSDIQSFPKVFKIDKFDIEESSSLKRNTETNNKSAMIDERQEEANRHEQLPYLKKNQQNLRGVISEDELNQINNENWNAVNSMNEEQRQNYLNLIQNTLPKHFIDKLRKKKNMSQQKTAPTTKISQMVPEIAKLSLGQQNQLKEQDRKQGKKQGDLKPNSLQQMDDENQDHKAVMDQIHLNIKTGKLVYLQENVLLTLSEEERNQRVNRAKIYEMLTAENNQSQIIASQLTLTWLKNIFPSENLVFYVDNIPFHSRIMLSEMYPLLKSIQNGIKSTKFYSCYIEMIVKSVEILTIIYKNLSDSQLSQQLLFIEAEFQKTQRALKQLLNSKLHSENEQNNQLQSKELLFESLGILFQSFKEQKLTRDQNSKHNFQQIDFEERIKKFKSSTKISDLIEAILIEQTLKKQEFEKYQIYPSINNFLQTITEYWSCKIKENLQNLSQRLSEADEFYSLIYQFVCHLNKKQRGFPFYRNLIKNIYLSLLQAIEQNYLKRVLQQVLSGKLAQNMNSKKNKSQIELKNSIFFKILFIYRQLSCDSEKLAVFLQNSKKDWLMSDDQASIVIYINFSHYMHVQDLKKEQIETLQKMLEWLKRELQRRQGKQGFLNSQQTLISLLGLFLSSEQEVYSLLDQSLLQQVFRQAVAFFESTVNRSASILTQNQVKSMVQNYNFNSFGNDIFTKVIFWIAVSVNPEIQALITEEVMMRYPMLFYYACEPIKSQLTRQSNDQQTLLKQSPLLGNPTQYIKVKQISKKYLFTYSSNANIKANLLKVLNLNLDFTTSSSMEIRAVQKILNTEQSQQREGFNTIKKKLNPENYFYRYLISSFLIQEKYKELF